jgi:MFS family permease
MFRAVGKSMASDFVPESSRAGGIGWYSATVGIFQLFASIIAGILWDQAGHAAVFLYGAAMAAVGGVVLLAFVPQVRFGAAEP